MDFFKTDEGRIHAGRVAAIGYLIFIVAGVAGGVHARTSGALITFAMGWWIAFCGKRPPRNWSEYTTGVRLRYGIQLGGVAVIVEIARLLIRYYTGH